MTELAQAIICVAILLIALGVGVIAGQLERIADALEKK